MITFQLKTRDCSEANTFFIFICPITNLVQTEVKPDIPGDRLRTYWSQMSLMSAQQTRDVRFGYKVGQIDPKWDKSGQIQYIWDQSDQLWNQT